MSSEQAKAEQVGQSQAPAVDSATTRAEHAQKHGLADASEVFEDADAHPVKKVKLDDVPAPSNGGDQTAVSERQKGTAPIKAEYLLYKPGAAKKVDDRDKAQDDDAAEASGHRGNDDRGGKKKGKNRGLNTSRSFGKSQDAVGLCASRAYYPEFSPRDCQFGEKCKFEHDLRRYLKEHKREDSTTLGGICPVWQDKGVCKVGWRCRWVGSHSKERTTEDGRQELILIENETSKDANSEAQANQGEENEDSTVFNNVSPDTRFKLMKRNFPTPRSDAYVKWIDISTKELGQSLHNKPTEAEGQNGSSTANGDQAKEATEEQRAQYTEAPFRASEKRRLYYGPETPVLAPLTTQGNMPFRRLCISLGCAFTYSEMAMGLPLIQGQRSEWALMKAHESEIQPPTVNPQNIVQDYDNSKDLKFGAQIAAGKPWQALKTTEILGSLGTKIRDINLNCGCPIDLVYREGAGSALLESHSKLEKILRGMNAVSQEIPITVKIRMGIKDNKPTATKLVERLVLGGYEAHELGHGPAGVAAITLHGRSRQQRYTRTADWSYISECATLIKDFNKKADAVVDTVKEVDERDRPAGKKVFFLGNGDCYSYEGYHDHVKNAGVDSVMIGRGALIKPWLFEEIEAGQYLDKSASERLQMVEKFTRFGLDAWGSDEMGVGTTRRFLLEWLSFACRYVPVGLLEHLPPNIQDRPPAYRGRNELETLLASDNYKDWIKISEMFLGPAHKDFKFEPKHKSNSYEAEG